MAQVSGETTVQLSLTIFAPTQEEEEWMSVGILSRSGKRFIPSGNVENGWMSIETWLLHCRCANGSQLSVIWFTPLGLPLILSESPLITTERLNSHRDWQWQWQKHGFNQKLDPHVCAAPPQELGWNEKSGIALLQAGAWHACQPICKTEGQVKPGLVWDSSSCLWNTATTLPLFSE